jgi:hypothetical protein
VPRKRSRKADVQIRHQNIESGSRGDNIWSGIRESNSRLHLGKVAYYHYTNPARMRTL